MLTHTHDLGDDGNLGPLDTENLGQFLEVYGGSFADAEYGIPQPGHAQVPELLVEKRFPQLRREKRDVLDNCLPNTP